MPAFLMPDRVGLHLHSALSRPRCPMSVFIAGKHQVRRSNTEDRSRGCWTAWTAGMSLLFVVEGCMICACIEPVLKRAYRVLQLALALRIRPRTRCGGTSRNSDKSTNSRKPSSGISTAVMAWRSGSWRVQARRMLW